MFENTGHDRTFLANVGRIADALERIVELMERPPEVPVSVTEWRHDEARRQRQAFPGHYRTDPKDPHGTQRR